MSHEKSPAPLAGELRSQWYRFLDTYEPLRPDLFRYCRHLTRSAVLRVPSRHGLGGDPEPYMTLHTVL